MKHAVIAVMVVALAAAFACKGETTVEMKCGQSAKDLKIAVGSSFIAKCPANCTTGSVWGIDTYTEDSAVCAAAIHAGVLKAEGGMVRVLMKPGLKEYKGAEKNGVKSNTWGSFDKSFVLEKK
ncbi:MAG: hypothetical protein EPN93_06450 [Spirochaetes bacterium]|nr:MAG: hypothetical protein EPN93_06450 [Spirochaetota bacterium]